MHLQEANGSVSRRCILAVDLGIGRQRMTRTPAIPEACRKPAVRNRSKAPAEVGSLKRFRFSRARGPLAPMAEWRMVAQAEYCCGNLRATRRAQIKWWC